MISLFCNRGFWLPQICNSSQCTTESGCAPSVVPCKEDDIICLELQEYGVIEATCIHGQWQSSYCASGWVCDDNHCVAPSTVIPNCAETCDLPNSASMTCDNGECKATSCETGYHLYEDRCEKNDDSNCGEHGISCSTETIENSSETECTPQGRCIAQTCEDAYHLYEDKCEKNDDSNCGGHEISCSIETIENSLETECTPQGRCIAQTCEDAYHLYEDKCEKNDDSNCGGHKISCNTETIENSLEVKCTPQGRCIAQACDDAYHLYEDGCEKDDNTNCGTHGTACTKDLIGGSLTVSCDTGKCLPLSCDSEHLLSGNRCLEKNCNENEIKCVNEGTTGKLYKCIGNVWQEQDTCTDNNSCMKDASDCGICIDDETRCMESSNRGYIEKCVNGAWEKDHDCQSSTSCHGNVCGECLNNATRCSESYSGQGYIEICQTGTWIKDHNCDSSASCKSSSECGVCTNGDAECVDGENIRRCNNGAWYESSCNSHGTFYCDAGLCKVLSCDEGYCPVGESCVSKNFQTDSDNCGGCGVVCKDEIAHASSAKCSSGTCVLTECVEQYHVYGNICEYDDDTHCNGHDVDCTANGQYCCWSAGLCASTCKDTSCSTQFIMCWD